jgi:hypothetical protein
MCSLCEEYLATVPAKPRPHRAEAREAARRAVRRLARRIGGRYAHRRRVRP